MYRERRNGEVRLRCVPAEAAAVEISVRNCAVSDTGDTGVMATGFQARPASGGNKGAHQAGPGGESTILMTVCKLPGFRPQWSPRAAWCAGEHGSAA